MQLHDFFLKLFCLIGREAQFTDVVAAQFLRVVVSQFRLHCVWAQHRVRGKGAGQATWNHIISQLQAQVVPVGIREKEVKRRIIFFLIIKWSVCVDFCKHFVIIYLYNLLLLSVNNLTKCKLTANSPCDILSQQGMVWRVKLYIESKVPGTGWVERILNDQKKHFRITINLMSWSAPLCLF